MKYKLIVLGIIQSLTVSAGEISTEVIGIFVRSNESYTDLDFKVEKTNKDKWCSDEFDKKQVVTIKSMNKNGKILETKKINFVNQGGASCATNAIDCVDSKPTKFACLTMKYFKDVYKVVIIKDKKVLIEKQL